MQDHYLPSLQQSEAISSLADWCHVYLFALRNCLTLCQHSMHEEVDIGYPVLQYDT